MQTKVNVLICQFAYGGNSSVSMTLPSHCPWLANIAMSVVNDDRVGKFAMKQFSDTPITMTRNFAVEYAKANDFDILLFLDSDNKPDCELKDDPNAKPFWETSFNFIFDRLVKGLPTVVAAPYCGGGEDENVFMFWWKNFRNSENTKFSLEQYTRSHAAIMAGIQPIAAGPTGVTMYSRSAFELMEPPYFKYEWADKTESSKASTEDVFNLRDISLLGWKHHKCDTVFGNWDAWASHYKVNEVRKPRIMGINEIGSRFIEAIERGVDSKDRIVDLDSVLDGKQDYEVNQQVEEETAEKVLTPQNAMAVQHHELFGHFVTSVGMRTSLEDLQKLSLVVEKYCQDIGEEDIRVVEIGSWVGESALAIANGLKTENSSVTCIDDFSGGGQEDLTMIIDLAGGPDGMESYFKKNTAKEPRIHLVRKSSQEICKSIDKADLDIVFVDACHTYEAAKEDMVEWQKHLKPEGLMLIHDYSEHFPGVVQAVDELLVDRGIDVNLIDGTSIAAVYNSEILKWMKQSKSKTL
jgi:predicted O-methyltransferase YrrM